MNPQKFRKAIPIALFPLIVAVPALLFMPAEDTHPHLNGQEQLLNLVFPYALALALAVTAAVTWKLRPEGPRKHLFISGFFVINAFNWLIGGVWVVAALNKGLDHAPSGEVSAEVATIAREEPNRSFVLTIKNAPGQKQPISFTVAEPLGTSLETAKASSVVLLVKPGRFGFAWIEAVRAP